MVLERSLFGTQGISAYSMTTVQLATFNTTFLHALEELLLRDGNHHVLLVDRPDPSLPGLIVAEAGLLGDLSSLSMPERFVVVARPADDLFRLWRADIRNVVFVHNPVKTVYLAILAAEHRLLIEMRGRGMSHFPPVEAGKVKQRNLAGPFILSDSSIDREVSIRSPGVYVLDDSEDVVGFHVTYVGRSDIDLNNQLHVHVGTYQRFKYEHCLSPREAFEGECIFYHDFEPWDNVVHPQRPAQSGWRCPRCKLLD